MITFKKFLEAEVGNLADMQLPDQSSAPTQPPNKQLKGSLTDNQKRVLALLSTSQLKSAPGRAREVITGDQNMVQAVKELKLKFAALDVTPDGVMINQKGIELATSHGVVDPNSGELSDYGLELASTNSKGSPNPKVKDIAGGPAGGPGMPPPGGMGMGLESVSLLKQLI